MLYTYPKYRTAIGVSVPHMVTIGIEVVLYISAWGLCVARFDKQGNILGASNREASDSAGLHAFLCLNRNKNKHYGYLKPDIQPT